MEKTEPSILLASVIKVLDRIAEIERSASLRRFDLLEPTRA
jgi:hypothetical protein